MQHIKIINDNNRPWSVVVVDNKVKFYDARYEHTNHGQFVASYYVSTILEGNSGLCLDGGVPDWKISAEAMSRIRAWLQDFEQ